MKCPHCKKEIYKVNVISECWQKAEVDNNGKIINFGSVEDILETVRVEHADNNCFGNITDITEG